MSPARLLIVEDDDDLRQILTQRFSEAGYSVATAATGPDALAAVEREVPDLVLLDVMLPGLDGVEVCRRLRADHPLLYILMLTARADELDRVVGLEVGADDYVTKPFEVTELVARVRALIRRKTAVNTDSDNNMFHFSGWTVDLSRFLLTSENGHDQRLSASEVALLEIFLRRPNRLVTRDQIREELGDRGDEFSFDRAIDVRVSRLRTKLKDSSKNSRIIQTIYVAGYILISDVS